MTEAYSISNERGLWIDCDYVLKEGDLIDVHTLEESGRAVTTREATVSHHLDEDEHGHLVVSTDKGAFSYYNSSIFILKEEAQ